jgi:hypothetical protein
MKTNNSKTKEEEEERRRKKKNGASFVNLMSRKEKNTAYMLTQTHTDVYLCICV